MYQANASRRPRGPALRIACAAITLALLPTAGTAFGQPGAPPGVEGDLARLAALGSRVSGYPGNQAAADLIHAEFVRLFGKGNVWTQEFDLPIPRDEGAELRVGGRAFRLHALWPNLVRTSSLPPEGLRGRIVDGSQGRLADFNGHDLAGAIVLLDFNTGQNWLNAPLLGAAAVVFVEPAETTRGEAEVKFLRCPVDVPRFYIGGNEAVDVKAAVAQGAQVGELRAAMPWRNLPNRNIIGFLRGSDPALADEAIILEAYYDSISVVPALSPGAENAAGIAALLQLARRFAAHPPARSVIFLATSGHFECLAGAREFVDLWGAEPRWAGDRGRRERELRQRQRTLEASLRQVTSPSGRDLDPDTGQVIVGRFKLPPRVREERTQRLRRAIAGQERDLELLQALGARCRQVPLFISLDLSTHGERLGVFQCGWYYAQEHLLRFYSPVGKYFAERMEKTVAPALGVRAAERFVDGTNPVKGREWNTHFPGKIAFDHEMAIRGGRAGISFATVSDARSWCDTPLDTPEHVEATNLQAQVAVLYGLLAGFLNDPSLDETALKRVRSLKKMDDLKDVTGTVLEFRRRESFLPSTPVPHALVLVQGNYRMMMGVHTELCAETNEISEFVLRGEMINEAAQLEAYACDAESGAITYAPDRGPDGEVKYPREVYGRAGLERPVIVFPCAPLDLYDLVDERYLQTLEQLYVYDAGDYSEPLSFGYALSSPAASGAEFPSYVEPCAVVLAPRDTRVSVGMGMGLLGLRLLALNSSLARPQGVGFDPSRTPRLTLTPLQVARDMWLLDEARMANLRRAGIENPRLAELHRLAGQSIEASGEALQQRRYDVAVAAARHAWGFESRAYPDVQKTAEDVVKGVLFYLGLLLPFAYFGERLFISARTIIGQIGGTAAVFLVVFAVLRAVHPAFELSAQPLIILLAFVIMALALIVIGLVVTRFNRQLTQMQQEETGVHEADVSRWSAATAAFSLGIANMRRRKMRTVLTAVTLILLTFTVLSFTSVRAQIRTNVVARPHRPPYAGLMIRDRAWFSLEEPTAFILANELGRFGVTAARTWYSSPELEKQIYIDLTRADDPTKTYTATVLLGLEATEREVSHADGMLVGGRWLQPGESDACLLPTAAAQALGVDARRLGTAVVTIFGNRFRVVGIFDEQRFRAHVDLDGESMAPVDYAVMRPEVIAELKRQAQQRSRIGTGGLQSLLQEYKHFSPGSLAILPARRVLELGGTLRSIAVAFHDPQQVGGEVDRLMKRFALSIYAGVGDRTLLYSSAGTTALGGAGGVVVPVLIAALIVLNTMLGSVYERTREIGIYSSLGLAPIHVAMLFIAEACVFANLGAIVGYLLGQGLAKVAFATGHTGGLVLNYSSLSTVGATVVVVAVVLLSTYFPSRTASRIATPGLERKWRLPDPEGDCMRAVLPFTVTGRDALGVTAFLKEFFDEYVGYAGGEFLADDVRLEGTDTPRGRALAVRLRMWLAPYDLGVCQDFELACVPAEEADIYAIRLTLERVAGDVGSWRKTNALFVRALRKQFLIWRTVPATQKAAYAARGEAALQATPAPAAAAPAPTATRSR